VPRGLFISWAPFSRRSRSLAAAFDLEMKFVSTPWPKRPLFVPLKYPWQAARTVVEVASTAGELWVMYPPTPALAVAGIAAAVRRRPLVVDMHTVAFYAPEWRLARRFELPLLRRATAVVVTNERLAAEVRGWGARAFVLPDPLPPAPPDAARSAGVGDDVTVVATFSKDEPLELLPAVAERLPDVSIAVTGASRGELGGWPSNLRCTGFLPDAGYWRQLAASRVVVVLTTRPDTLLSGGYEAMVLGRPLVTSDHAVLREYFGDAAVYARAGAGALADAVATALDDGAELSRRMRVLAQVREREWQGAAALLCAAVRGQ
jgi:glycosyltransferase involved in cell wall biosynthesis